MTMNPILLGYGIEFAQASPIWCKLRFYLATVATLLPPSFIVLACVDRFMMSSMSTKVRQWSRPSTAYRLLILVSLLWIIYAIHALVGSNIQTANGYSYCFIDSGVYSYFNAVSAIIFHYIVPPTLMMTLGLLTIVNVRRAQMRVHLTRGPLQMQQKDRHLLRMLLFQVLVSVVFTIPPSVFQVE